MKRSYSYSLLLTQLLLMAALVFRPIRHPSISFVFSMAALIFALWAMWHLRFQLSALPDPVKNKALITTGPYRMVRHPMYLSVLLWALGKVVAAADMWGGILFFALLVALKCKIAYEEQLLMQQYPAYQEYKKQTKALIPFVL